MKTMISSQVKNLGLGGRSEEKKEEGGTSDPAAAQGMTREEYEEYQKQVIEEKWVHATSFPFKSTKKFILARLSSAPQFLPLCSLDAFPRAVCF